MASGVSSMMRSTPVSVSMVRMLRPSRPMMRPFISSLGRGTTLTVSSATGVRRAALDGLGHHFAGAGLALLLHPGLHLFDLEGSLVGHFALHLAE